MGIDFLDLTFQLEKKHKAVFDTHNAVIELTDKQVENGTTRWGSLRMDWRVGVFYECYCRHFYSPCLRCRKGLSKTGPNCPKCGAPLAHAEITWPQFCEVLAILLGKKSINIRTDHWLIGDLGFC